MINKEQVICKISSEKIIAIARGIYGEQCINLAKALYDGGISLLEIQALNSALGDKMMFGAGTVISAQQVAVAADAGAKFIISPNTDESVIAETIKRGVVSIPGAATPTEILAASRMGADFVKLFPSAQLGFDYIKSIRAPINQVKLLATGGVNLDNIGMFLKLGMVGVGVGGNLCSKKLLAEGRYDEITATAKKFVAALEI